MIISKTELVEGDILNEEPQHMHDEMNYRSAIRNVYNLWPSGQVPYTIAGAFYDDERAIISQAMEEYHQKTCIRY